MRAVAEAVPLAPLTTLRVGPVARRLITCASTEQVVAVLRQLDSESREGDSDPLLVLAGGSNLVVADTLTDLTAVRLANSGITIDGNLVRAEAGAVWDDVVVATIEHGLGGLECLSGIPGSAGATPVQNVGAYGAEVSDTITRVRLLDRRQRGSPLGAGRRARLRLSHQRVQAGRRAHIPAVVLEVEFALDASGRSAPLRYGELAAALDASSGERADPRAVREAVLALRARKGMVLDPDDHDTWSVGSFFTNPVVAPEVYERLGRVPGSTGRCRTIRRPTASSWPPAGWWSGRDSARAIPDDATARCRLSTKHALALTNRGGASADGCDRAGPHRPRRGPRRVWYHTGTRACAAGLRL